MKKSILKISLLISLSTLFSACGSHKPNHHSDIQSDKKPPMTKPKPNDKEKNTTNWAGTECVYGVCKNNNIKKPNEITIENISKGNTSPETNKIITISLSAGENTNKDNQHEYKITLLQENKTDLAYYGYTTYNSKQNTKKRVKILSGINENYINNKSLPTDFNAKYEGKNSFIYTNFSNFDEDHKAQYADITLNYNNGSISGSVTKIKESNEVIFDITKGEHNSLLFTPTNKSGLSQEDVSLFDIKFIDSVKNNDDRKYIIGTGIGYDWMGVFSAEKKQ
ncbi:hypothetical protein PcPA57_15140 [Pasteurella canis]|uniref:hypothetical protein n=1 Tax=Pasteurella canis TaxID=753 RepID=UPI001E301271|nr:hypothetical protein [Pasteurella canis]GJJ80794.1 hypothetical protein PcPA57_15140 [Pasteurella canis]